MSDKHSEFLFSFSYESKLLFVYAECKIRAVNFTLYEFILTPLLLMTDTNTCSWHKEAIVVIVIVFPKGIALVVVIYGTAKDILNPNTMQQIEELIVI